MFPVLPRSEFALFMRSESFAVRNGSRFAVRAMWGTSLPLNAFSGELPFPSFESAGPFLPSRLSVFSQGLRSRMGMAVAVAVEL